MIVATIKLKFGADEGTAVEGLLLANARFEQAVRGGAHVLAGLGARRRWGVGAAATVVPAHRPCPALAQSLAAPLPLPLTPANRPRAARAWCWACTTSRAPSGASMAPKGCPRTPPPCCGAAPGTGHACPDPAPARAAWPPGLARLPCLRLRLTARARCALRQASCLAAPHPPPSPFHPPTRTPLSQEQPDW